MPILPADVINAFVKVKTQRISIAEFERWVKSSKELFENNPNAIHQLLITFDYNQENAGKLLIKLLNKYVDFGEIEKLKLEEMLRDVRQRKRNTPAILEQLYHLHWQGYDFLASVSIGFGFAMVQLPGPYNGKHWSSLSESQLASLIRKLSPALDVEITKIEMWLKNKKIVLTGEDAADHFGYIDSRMEAEKKLPTEFDVLNLKQRPRWKIF